MVEDLANGLAGALVFLRRVRPEVDALEHERAERKHRRANLLALDDVAGRLGRLDEVVDERVDALRAARAEQRDLVLRQVFGIEDPVPDGVVDVVVDVRDPVDDAHDLALVRLGLDLTRVLEDPVAHLPRQVERFRDPERLLVVPEAEPEALPQALVERLLAHVPERRVPHVVAQANRLREVLVQAQRPRDAARDGGRLERVCHPRPEVVARRVDEDLGLALQPAKWLRVEDAIAVTLERRPHEALVLLARAPA